MNLPDNFNSKAFFQRYGENVAAEDLKDTIEPEIEALNEVMVQMFHAALDRFQKRTDLTVCATDEAMGLKILKDALQETIYRAVADVFEARELDMDINFTPVTKSETARNLKRAH